MQTATFRTLIGDMAEKYQDRCFVTSVPYLYRIA